jgi:hypothetical protein
MRRWLADRIRARWVRLRVWWVWLRVWWALTAPARADRCRTCGCTDAEPCVDACAWLEHGDCDRCWKSRNRLGDNGRNDR